MGITQQDTRQVVAVDVGGTEIKAALVAVGSDHARQLQRRRRRTPRATEADQDDATAGAATVRLIVDAVVELIEELRAAAEGPVVGAGIVVPGIVDEETGVAVYSANLGWRDAPLRELIAARSDIPIAFGHDIRASGLAEIRFGAARGCQDAVVLPIGTGIAAALLVDGRLLRGAGFAGEIGHVDIGHRERCTCGAVGCVEAVASSSAVARRYAERVGRPVKGAAEVATAVQAGDPVAIEVWQDAMDGLTRAILVLVTLLAPEVVVLGGGLAQSGDLLIAPVRERLAALVSFHRVPLLRPAELGDEAGCLGAALLAVGTLEDR
ncbi:ROK family protein [Actinoalloteichus hymeniacidonis]|uniref:Transcriptional regulator/sugar kinase n=1 Tax=Actinoalloteichus hymeniacidonis TaxID=340345 RepID=A0AAC9N013_9PSEU|nr:ROK family protein [Actinoalloteichus hymeniacidonis]AOS66013.1 transcriptional regulator/sugar kinase [Actinoalloteichus hymeniacidonis]MBB5905885.1 glucokinase [Actinoalloteichus hymeniacidonis]